MQVLNHSSNTLTSQQEAFDNIAALAAQICQAEYAAVILPVDAQLKVVSTHNFAFTDDLVNLLLKAVNKCGSQELQVLTDMKTDERFMCNPLVNSNPHLRFLSFISIKPCDAHLEGWLCVSDQVQRELATEQASGLELLAKQLAFICKGVTQPRESESSFHDPVSAVFHHALDAVVILDEQGVIRHWNPKAENIYGWKAEEAVGKLFYQAFLPQHHHTTWHEAIAQIQQASKSPLLNKPVEITALHKNGNEFDIALGISSAEISGVKYNIVYISDITDRKTVLTELVKQNDFYENILNKLPTDIAVFDANHKYLFVNPGAISNPEYRKYIIGKDDYEYVAYRNRDISVAHSRRDKFLQVKNTGKEIRWEEGLKNPNGETITSLRRLFPVFDDDGELTLVIGFGIDITDRKVMEEKQLHLVKQLSAQNKQLIDFCNIVSHNLRGPLVNLSMLVEYIEKSQDEVEQKFLISKLSPVLDNLHATFNELVESIQIKQNLEIKSEKLDLQTFVNRTLETLQTEIEKLDAVIDVDFNEAPIVSFPSKYLLSICHNLISNALKYHSPKRRPIIKLRTSRENDTIIFSVKDNGLGIDIAKHKDNFFKIGKVFHRHPDAKGFGLYMTKTQIEAMGGDIWVESAPDKGSCFYVAFKNQNI